MILQKLDLVDPATLFDLRSDVLESFGSCHSQDVLKTVEDDLDDLNRWSSVTLFEVTGYYLVVFSIEKGAEWRNDSHLNDMSNLFFLNTVKICPIRSALTWWRLPETVRLEIAQAASFLVAKSDCPRWSIIGAMSPLSITDWNPT